MLKQSVSIFRIFKHYTGRHIYGVLSLSALGSLMEGVGIAMLLPLIAAIGVDSTRGDVMGQTGVQALLHAVLDRVGVAGSLAGILLLMAVIFLTKGVVAFASEAYRCHLQACLMQTLKLRMFDRFGTMEYAYYSSQNTGHFVNIVNTQMHNFVMTFGTFVTCLTIMISVFAYLLMACIVAWRFALIAVVSGVFLLALFQGLNAYVHKLSIRTSQELSVLNKLFVQSLLAFKYLTSTSRDHPLKRDVGASMGKLTDYMRRQGIAQSLSTAMGEPLSICLIVLVVLHQVLVLNEPLVPIFVSLALFNRALNGMLGMQRAWQATLKHAGSIDIVEREFAALERYQQVSGLRRVGPLKRQLEFRDASFAYGGNDHPVIKSLSLVIPANTTVAIVGPSGAGKSTVVDMLTLLLRPVQGEFLIDGVPCHDVELASWRTQIGYVSQETVVFDDTVANNICLWKDDYNADAEARRWIETVAREAFADRFIEALPGGYNALIGDRGVRLSGGQRQRLFLARELYKRPRLLILDEATSALDSESEASIRDSIDRLRGGMTVVQIAHRLSTVRHADQIVVIEDGRLVEAGTYADLMQARTGIFRRMVELQNL